MNRPKFQSRADRENAELGLELRGSPWDPARIREREEKYALSLPVITRPYFDIDASVARRLGRLRHDAFLRRTGGVRGYEPGADEVHLLWDCCGHEELLAEVHYDRHGDLRPEDVAIVKALSYYHRCDA